MSKSKYYNKDFSKESISNTVFSTTNQMMLAFPRDLAERCKPFPIKVFRYVDTEEFDSEVRKDIVLRDVELSKHDDLNHADWVGVAWTRRKLDRMSHTNRKYQGLNASLTNFRSGDSQLQVIAKAEMEVSVTFFSSSPEWLQCIQEILSVNHIDGGFDFEFNGQTYRASYIPPFTMGNLSYAGRSKSGNLVLFNLILKISYPLALNIEGGSLVKEIVTKTSAISHQDMEDYKDSGKAPDISEDAIVGVDSIVGEVPTE